MSLQLFDGGGHLRQWWNDATRVYTEYDAAGNVTTTRPYGNVENQLADAQAVDDTRAGNLLQLFQQARTAIANNNTFLGIASPTTAQAVSQVQALTRQMNKLIRVDLGLLAEDPTALDSTN